LSSLTKLKWHKVANHNHEASNAYCTLEEGISNWRQKAFKNPDGGKEGTAKAYWDTMVTDLLANCPNHERGDLLNILKGTTFESKKDRFYRVTRKQRPKPPKDLDDVDIPSYGPLSFTKQAKPFHRGKTPGHGELFMSDTQVAILKKAEDLYFDGTFGIVCWPYYQVSRSLSPCVAVGASAGVDRPPDLPSHDAFWI
jgi:hypothetical protein